jgi:hypothetical protein
MVLKEAKSARPVVTFAQVSQDPKVNALIDGANDVLKSMGYTEHGRRHVTEVSDVTGYILQQLGVREREVELGKIAAYLHDIGNVISRVGHPLHGGAMAFKLLDDMGMPAEEVAPVLAAIGNHEESTGQPVSTISAAVIIADKSDVHRSRVQNPIMESFDIHDRVNYAVTESNVRMDNDAQVVALDLTIDTQEASVMEYFEIFLHRMVMCRKSAEVFGYTFRLCINGTTLQ